MKFLALFFCVITVAVVNAQKVSYHDYKIYSVFFETEEQFQLLSEMRNTDTNVHFMQLFHKLKFAEIMVAPELEEQFLTKITGYGLTYELVVKNVEDILNKN